MYKLGVMGKGISYSLSPQIHKEFAKQFEEIETAQSGNFDLPFDNSLLNTIYPYNHV